MSNFVWILFVACLTMIIMIANPVDGILLSADPVEEMDVIVVGKIISTNPNYGTVETKYYAEVEEIIKGWNLLENGNKTESIQFVATGILGYEGSQGAVYDKIFHVGDRALLMLKQTNGILRESLWSRITKGDCSGADLMQLYSAPSGLRLLQQGSDKAPFYINEPITAKYYYYNGDLSNKTINIEFKVSSNWPHIIHEKNISISLEKCQPFAESSTEFVIPDAGAFSISVILNNDEVTTESVSGIKMIEHVLSPLTQHKTGIPIGQIQCKEELELALKLSDGSPICVTPQTKQILIERGWATSA